VVTSGNHVVPIVPIESLVTCAFLASKLIAYLEDIGIHPMCTLHPHTTPAPAHYTY
jgi:hypothetical protein